MSQKIKLLKQAIQGLPAKSSILFGVLNWGIGHASRSAVIIQELLGSGHHVVLASDGEAKRFLLALFPDLECRETPSYNITYKFQSMLANMVMQGPNILKAISKEQRLVKKWHNLSPFDIIISDNRYGFYIKDIQSILITHQYQLQADSALAANLANRLLKKWLKPFNKYWCPDFDDRRLSGDLSESNLPIRFIGPLSLMKKQEVEEDIDILFLLSGPEPQRSKLEDLLINVSTNNPAFAEKKMVLIRGKMVAGSESHHSQLEIKNYVLKEELAKHIQRAKLVVCRSGYSTVMDLDVLAKKAVFIPTPGQTEQEYLAKKLSKKSNKYKWVSQRDLEEKLEEVVNVQLL